MRTVTKLILAMIIVAIVTVAAFFYQRLTAPTMDELVTSTMTYDSPECNLGKPIAVTFHNNGKEDIQSIRWSFSANEKGHSSEIVRAFDPQNADKWAGRDWYSDLIIKPGSEITLCSTDPLSTEGYRREDADVRLILTRMTTNTTEFDDTHPRGY